MRGLRDRPAVPPMAWERRAMSIAIRQLHPFFMGEVSGIDLSTKLTPDEAATIEADTDPPAGLIFPGHRVTRLRPIEFQRHFDAFTALLPGKGFNWDESRHPRGT